MDNLDEPTLTIDQSGQTGGGDASGTGAPGDSDKILAVGASASALSQGSAFPDNQLMMIASELLALCVKLPRIPEPDNLGEFRRRIYGMIHALKIKGSQIDLPVEKVDKACFLFAIVIDELVLCSNWPNADIWANDSLLSRIFKVRNGGELFFTLTDRMLRQPRNYADLLELVFFFLAIGFQGKHRGEKTDAIHQVQHDIKVQVEKYIPVVDASKSAEVPRERPKPKVMRTRFGLIGLIGAILVLLLVLTSNTFLRSSAHSRGQQFQQLTLELDEIMKAKNVNAQTE
jgi:type VI secretion system protein ImpK|tara:strand:+ start:80 stop:940 length:861 start_codon:yes stop_codon:yes gene_type:complete